MRTEARAGGGQQFQITGHPCTAVETEAHGQKGFSHLSGPLAVLPEWQEAILLDKIDVAVSGKLKALELGIRSSHLQDWLRLSTCSWKASKPHSRPREVRAQELSMAIFIGHPLRTKWLIFQLLLSLLQIAEPRC